MSDLNHVIEIGRLTRDISERDFGYTTGGTARLNLCKEFCNFYKAMNKGE